MKTENPEPKTETREKEILPPGLYALGGAPSVGKTAFVSQLADRIAKTGKTVLFFSGQENMHTAASRSLSREMFTAARDAGMNTARCPSAADLRMNEIDPEYAGFFEECHDRYGNSVKNLAFSSLLDLPLGVNATVGMISEQVKAVREEHPVVIIDCLQNLGPNMEQNVKALKEMQKENDIAVVVTVNLRRTALTTGVGFGAFKGNGGIEFAADVLLGLQLSVADSPWFMDIESTNPKIHDVVRFAKQQEPRAMLLICMKDTVGSEFMSEALDYYAAHDTFIRCEYNDQDKRLNDLLEKYKN